MASLKTILEQEVPLKPALAECQECGSIYWWDSPYGVRSCVGCNPPPDEHACRKLLRINPSGQAIEVSVLETLHAIATGRQDISGQMIQECPQAMPEDELQAFPGQIGRDSQGPRKPGCGVCTRCGGIAFARTPCRGGEWLRVECKACGLTDSIENISAGPS